MCGIAGYYCWGPQRPGPDLVQVLLTENQTRGRDAAGFAFLDDGGHITTVKNTGPADRLISTVSQHMPGVWDKLAASPIVIAHTRAQTQGDARDNANNHPVIFGGWAVVHNGMVLNDDHLFERQGVPRFAEVDTAAIPLLLETETGDSPFGGLSLLAGSVSAAMWSQNRPTELALCRLGGADIYLFLAPDQQMLVFSSAASVFRKLQRLPVGDLLFTTASQLPDNRLLVLRPERAAATLHVIIRRPFHKAREVAATSVVTSPRTSTVGTSTRASEWHYKVVRENCNHELPNRLPPDVGRLGAEPQFSSFDRDATYSAITKLGALHVAVPTVYGTWHTTPAPVSSDAHICKHFRPRKALKKLADRRGWVRWWQLATTDPVRALLDDTAAYDLVTIRRESANGTISIAEPGVCCPHCGVLTAIHKQKESGCLWCHIKSRLPQAILRGNSA